MRTSINESSNESSGGEGITEVQCEHEMKEIHFSNVSVTTGQCVEHVSENCILFSSVDSTNGQMYFLSEWMIGNDDKMIASDQVTKQIGCIEQELKSLLKLKHPNLINYINMEHSILQDGKIVVNLLTEFILGKYLLLQCNPQNVNEFCSSRFKL